MQQATASAAVAAVVVVRGVLEGVDLAAVYQYRARHLQPWPPRDPPFQILAAATRAIEPSSADVDGSVAVAGEGHCVPVLLFQHQSRGVSLLCLAAAHAPPAPPRATHVRVRLEPSDVRDAAEAPRVVSFNIAGLCEFAPIGRLLARLLVGLATERVRRLRRPIMRCGAERQAPGCLLLFLLFLLVPLCR